MSVLKTKCNLFWAHSNSIQRLFFLLFHFHKRMSLKCWQSSPQQQVVWQLRHRHGTRSNYGQAREGIRILESVSEAGHYLVYPLAEHFRLTVHYHRLPAWIFDTGFDAFNDAAWRLFVFTDKGQSAKRGEFGCREIDRHFLARHGFKFKQCRKSLVICGRWSNFAYEVKGKFRIIVYEKRKERVQGTHRWTIGKSYWWHRIKVCGRT